MIILDKPEQIEYARFAALFSGLSLQAKGIKMNRGRTALAILQDAGMTDKRTSKGALKQIAILIAESEDNPFRFGPVHKRMIQTLVDLDVPMTKRERKVLGL